MSKVIYLTGAPATGKSTLTENLAESHSDTSIFTYSKELLKIVRKREGHIATQDDLRQHSASVITHEDVLAVDLRLLDLLKKTRDKQNIVIDSHPVTIENYGFRITPFSKEQIQGLKPDIIVCLYAGADTISMRILENPAGRPVPTDFELDLHTQLQCQVASIYALETGARLFMLDASATKNELLRTFIKVTKMDQ